MGKPFYSAGLRFSCKKCSACCRYDSGYVFISEKDLVDLAAELKMDANGFQKTYCRWVTGWQGTETLSLKEKSNNDCILWNSGCSVYNARPLQCRAFPFWEAIVNSEDSWKIAASGCPGMNSGAMHDMKTIVKFLEMRTKEPPISKQGRICK